jgi:hypothetical protein
MTYRLLSLKTDNFPLTNLNSLILILIAQLMRNPIKIKREFTFLSSANQLNIDLSHTATKFFESGQPSWYLSISLCNEPFFI